MIFIDVIGVGEFLREVGRDAGAPGSLGVAGVKEEAVGGGREGEKIAFAVGDLEIFVGRGGGGSGAFILRVL
jgi:hypothetical protein